MEITEFLAARYAEVEATELAQIERGKVLVRTIKEVAAQMGADTPVPPDRPPSRGLAALAVKRRLLELADEMEREDHWGISHYAERIRAELAAEFASHPDHSAAWRIDG